MRRRARHPTVLCVLLAVLGVACGERGPELHVRKQRLGVLPKDRRSEPSPSTAPGAAGSSRPVRKVDGITRLYFDDHPITRFDEVVWGPTFLRADGVAWVGSRGGAVFRVEAWAGDAPPA